MCWGFLECSRGGEHGKHAKLRNLQKQKNPIFWINRTKKSCKNPKCFFFAFFQCAKFGRLTSPQWSTTREQFNDAQSWAIWSNYKENWDSKVLSSKNFSTSHLITFDRSRNQWAEVDSSYDGLHLSNFDNFFTFILIQFFENEKVVLLTSCTGFASWLWGHSKAARRLLCDRYYGCEMIVSQWKGRKLYIWSERRMKEWRKTRVVHISLFFISSFWSKLGYPEKGPIIGGVHWYDMVVSQWWVCGGRQDSTTCSTLHNGGKNMNSIVFFE